jgi:FtsH-binding integral membrane protein
MTGPLSIGLGVLIGAGLGRMFFPASTLLQNVSIYGGMAVFGGLLLVDIQRVMHRIRFTPPSSYDPINSSIGIYLDIVNLFTRILEYMAMSKNNRR